MYALTYILLKRFKNRMKAFIKNPVSLIMGLLFIAILLIPIFTKGSSPVDTNYRNIEELHAIIMVLYCSVFIMTSYNGLSKGASLYTMPDVNLVFTSPISPKKVLFYGLIQQMGTSLLIGMFLLFQYSWLNSMYGITVVTLTVILLGYAIIIFCGQFTSMVLYSFVTGSEKRTKAAKFGLLCLCAIAILYLLFTVYPEKDQLIVGFTTALTRSPIALFPVGGWTQVSIIGIISSNWTNAGIGLVALLLYIVALVMMISKGDTDFYEDVLQASERLFSAIAASKQGRFDGATIQNVKLGKTGINKGLGANTFYYKHRLESRRSRLLILDRSSIIFILISIAFAFFMKNSGIMPIFMFSSYMQLFSVSLGRWARELLLPYVYLVPESEFAKLIHCLREGFLKIAVDAIILFIPIGILLNLKPMILIACILARISLGLLFTSANILVQRYFSGIVSKLLKFIIYFLVIIVLLIPDVIVASLLTFKNPQFLQVDTLIFLSISLINLLLSILVIFVSKNMLKYSEMNTFE